MPILSWKSVATLLARQPPGQAMRIASHTVEHPVDGGLRPTTALPVGQRGDYRLALDAGGALLVHDFGRYYVATLEQASLVLQPSPTSGEAEVNPVSIGMAVGRLLGLYLGRTSTAASVGAALGALGAALVVAEKNRGPLSDASDRPVRPQRVLKTVRKSHSTVPGTIQGRKKQKP
jgi:hypothetical protein